MNLGGYAAELLPSAWSTGSSNPPFSTSRGGSSRTEGGKIGHPVVLTLQVILSKIELETWQHRTEGAVLTKYGVHLAPRAIVLWQVSPFGSRAQFPEDVV